MKTKYFISRDDVADRLIKIDYDIEIPDGAEVLEYFSEPPAYLGAIKWKSGWKPLTTGVDPEDMKDIGEKQIELYQAIGEWPSYNEVVDPARLTSYGRILSGLNWESAGMVRDPRKVVTGL